MDLYGSHKREAVISHLKNLKTNIVFIPPKTTRYFQRLDVVINAPFKANLRYEFENWMSMIKKILLRRDTKKGLIGRQFWDLFQKQ